MYKRLKVDINGGNTMGIHFKPLDLSKGVVNIVFKNCITDSPDKTSPVAFFRLKRYGYPEDSAPVFFNRETLEEHKQMIYYVLGQLENVHTMKQPILHPHEFFSKYNGEKWTEDSVAVMKLIHLALATGAISQFSNTEDITGIITSRVPPTLSPKDPNFPEWWEQNKSKWV